MRKFTMFVLCLLALSMFAMPAFAQGGEAPHAATNWVAITSGFAMALAVALAALGQSRVASAACEGLAQKPRRPSRNSAGADPWTRLYRISSPVHIGNHLCEGSCLETLVS